MIFNSLDFLFFFPAVFFSYYVIPHKWRWLLLLSASYYFYMCWQVAYAVLILFQTSVDYYVTLKMSGIPDKPGRRPYLFLSLASNLGFLFVFKYYDFFTGSISLLCKSLGIGYAFPIISLLLPVGISFYTFQAVGYVVDVYKGELAPERHFGRFALFITYFPQLVSGPIERASRLLPQLNKKIEFDYGLVTEGLKLMAWGLFKKMVIADRLALGVDTVYSHPENFSGPYFLIATVFFAFQIYCDFSGYTDIARGASLTMGIRLMKNFERPYLAENISDFWRRWHISLTSWFKNFVYIPLGGNRSGKEKWFRNILVVFLISGLWHGANWTFIIWGLLNGLFIIGSHLIPDKRLEWPWKTGTEVFAGFRRVVRTGVTFSVVCFAWIFFRASNLTDASYIISHLFVGVPGFIHNLADYIFNNADKNPLSEILHDMHYTRGGGIIAFASVSLLVAGQIFREARGSKPVRMPIFIRWPAYCCLVLSIMYYSVYSGHQFIYFRF